MLIGEILADRPYFESHQPSNENGALRKTDGIEVKNGIFA
jgi:hypothetical protein